MPRRNTTKSVDETAVEVIDSDPAVAVSKDDSTVSRPSSLADFNGQSAAKQKLTTFLSSARQRGSNLDHTLFFGPPGLGKTTLAQIIAGELGVGFRQIAAPAIKQPTDLVSVLMGVDERDVIFIDEIHRLPIQLEEMLYIALEDFRLDVIVGEGTDARPLGIPLPKFTLVGATTNPGGLSIPLRDRFGIQIRLELYTDEEMRIVVGRAGPQLGIDLTPEAALEIGRRARGTPRIALRLLNRIRDYAVIEGVDIVDHPRACRSMDALGIDSDGFDDTDRNYIRFLSTKQRPVGLTTIAAALGESEDNIEFGIEPYLLRKGVIEKTPKGRVLALPAETRKKQEVFSF
jgi:Holliday junction DNA helicase RuvB